MILLILLIFPWLNFLYHMVKYSCLFSKFDFYQIVNYNLTIVEKSTNGKNMNTTKKTKIVGSETYINNRTGEYEDFEVIRMEDTDFDFEKLWLGHLLAAIDEFSNQKMKILAHLLKKREKANNTVIATVSDLCQQTGISRPTIIETLKILEKNGVIRRKTGVIFINPSVVFRGSHSNRMRILLDYSRIETKETPQEHESEANVIPIQKAS